MGENLMFEQKTFYIVISVFFMFFAFIEKRSKVTNCIIMITAAFCALTHERFLFLIELAKYWGAIGVKDDQFTFFAYFISICALQVTLIYQIITEITYWIGRRKK